MLGRLARWLRALGYDTVYDASADDRALVELANTEDRVLLTRDRHLLRELRPRRAVEITMDTPLDQLAALVEKLALSMPDELFRRCLICNSLLDDVPPALAAGLVPPAARGLPGPVRRCPTCGRVYWPGSHVRRMTRALGRVFPGVGESLTETARNPRRRRAEPRAIPNGAEFRTARNPEERRIPDVAKCANDAGRHAGRWPAPARHPARRSRRPAVWDSAQYGLQRRLESGALWDCARFQAVRRLGFCAVRDCARFTVRALSYRTTGRIRRDGCAAV